MTDVRVRNLRKAYGGEPALRGVDLDLRAGEVHALLGPNGSGKSTLIGCLSGKVEPDEGTIEIGGEAYTKFTPRQAHDLGTAVIYQQFSLIPTLSVADNVFLGHEVRKVFRIDRSTQAEEAAALLDRLSRPIATGSPVGTLSAGDQQIVEIAKAMRRRPRVLVLDEPTAALGDREARLLGDQVSRLAEQGIAVLYVTHLINEVFAVADRVTVLRDGQVTLRAEIGDVTRDGLVAAIAPGSGERGSHAGSATEEMALELENFTVGDGVGPVSTHVRKGEVVGLFGLLGSGRTELLEGLFGFLPSVGGTVHLHGRPFQPRSPADSLARGIALVAGDRLRQSMFPTMSAADNVLLPHFRRLGRLSIRRRRHEATAFEQIAERVRLKAPHRNAPAATLSGGNQQKLALGRWLVQGSVVSVILLDEPTTGIDVSAREEIYRVVSELARERGVAVLFTSSDPEEVEALADRTLVMRQGEIVAELPRGGFTLEALVSMAHGADVTPDHSGGRAS